MKIKSGAPCSDYKFHNPKDTADILYKLFLKKEEWEFNKREQREKRKDWWYECISKFPKNFGLLFGKFIPIAYKSQKEKNEQREEESDNKKKYLELIIKEFTDEFFTEYILKRQEQTIKISEKYGYYSEGILAECSWRLVIGLGGTHPQETSMTLHHIYGIPYIPGSAVKGVTRHWVIWNEFEGKEEEAEKNPDFQAVFGTQKQAGKIIFCDAYPVGEIKLKLDVMTPHYPEYYSENQPPADWQNPRPINFLTVEKTKFKFYLLSREEDILNKAKEWLKQALEKFGIGAKTSVGYGYFINFEE